MMARLEMKNPEQRYVLPFWVVTSSCTTHSQGSVIVLVIRSRSSCPQTLRDTGSSSVQPSVSL